MEEVSAAKENEQEQKEAGNEETGDPVAQNTASETGSGEFDADAFATMMEEEMVAFSLSWDPLMKLLRALSASIARQGKTQQMNNAVVKKMEDEVAALRDDVARAEEEKKEAAAVIKAIQGQMGEMQNRLEEVHGKTSIRDQEEPQQASPEEKSLEKEENGEELHGQTPSGDQDEQHQENAPAKEVSGEDADGPTTNGEQDEQRQEGDDLSEGTPVNEGNGEESRIQAPAISDEDGQVPEEANLGEKSLTKEVSGVDSISSAAIKEASTPALEAFVTAKELAEAKEELRNELTRALEHVSNLISHEATDETSDSEKEGNESNRDGNSAVNSDSKATSTSEDKSPRKSQVSKLPFLATIDLQQEVKKLQGLQDALNARIDGHDQHLNALNDRMENFDRLSAPRSNSRKRFSIPSNEVNVPGESTDTSGNNAESTLPNENYDKLVVNISDLVENLKRMKTVQDEQENRLQEHDQAVQKHTAEIKTLVDSLDDLNVQQQTLASVYSSSSNEMGETTAEDEQTPAEGSEKASDKNNRRVSSPQLDLSLVFTKLADMRRSTDASLSSLQETIKDVSGTAQNQQDQLDALRNNMAFQEHLQTHLLEARLAMQKELLARNETFQDRTESKLAEWHKTLEAMEEKIGQGDSNDDTLQTLQQMQRWYHRALLSMDPVLHLPLSIAEMLQILSGEVKQLQSAAGLGVIPLRVTDSDLNNRTEVLKAEIKEQDREEEYTRKLRYLDEEIDTTVQMNITTEKKTDPLIKGLEVMGEKLELLWSMWHRNYNFHQSEPNEVVDIQDDSRISAPDASENRVASEEHRKSLQQLHDSNGLQEMELRLSGAVRRLGMVEEDVERLNNQTVDMNAREKRRLSSQAAIFGQRDSSPNNLQAGMVMEEIDKLRKDTLATDDAIQQLRNEMFVEMNKIMAQLPEGHSNNNSRSSLVSVDRRMIVEAAVKQGDALTDLYSQTTGHELGARLYNSPEGLKQFYDNIIQEVTKKLSGQVDSDKSRQRVPSMGNHAAIVHGNYRLLLDNLAQQVNERLQTTREFTTEELARLRKELMEQLKNRIEKALRDLRADLMLSLPPHGDSTAVGTMCVACSRSVPVSSLIRETGSPSEIVYPEPAGTDYEQANDDFVFRAGFKMPVNDRKIVTLPFLSTNKTVLDKPAGKRKHPPRHSYSNRVDKVVREAMELDRAVTQDRNF